ncbi:MAG: hypothetical protein U9N85_01715 [Bacteroidota bacterium]|nr:hypothetical protein [Bacteroidota bacterium]
MKTRITITVIIFFAFVISGCDIINNKDVEPNFEFTKVISNLDFDSDFYAHDIKQTSDGGFIILASVYNNDNTYIWTTPHIIKIDSMGNMVGERAVESPYVNPVGNMIQTSGGLYFACMNETSLETHLLKINETTAEITPEISYTNISYPLAVSQNSDNSFLIQGYNIYARTTSLSEINADMTIAQSNTFSLYEDAEEIVINHLTKRGKQYPFFTGEAGDYYYFNGLYNYSFSLVFVNKTDLSYQGVMNGFRYSGAVSSLSNISTGNYAFSTFFEGNNYFFPAGEINETAVSSIENLDGDIMPNIQTDANVITKSVTINGTDMTVIASNTNDNQIILMFFDQSGSLLNTKKIMDNHRIEISQLIQTNDDSIVIVGRTFAAGQFSRVFVSKISVEDL